jgi:hypothetical protein
MSGLPLFVACATMTPDARIADEIYWDAAKVCEFRYRSLHLDRIDTDGNASLHADAETRMDLPAFIGVIGRGSARVSSSDAKQASRSPTP